ncbi:EAL domain-containing protein [Acetobacterium bakii]|uniref:EAL domain-containing protein n=1 Tax=Acetobacterium bakii TaxID=52689 RepID=UPI000681B3AB|nr:EAL domain-containing protein [Acetobacterium bakii]
MAFADVNRVNTKNEEITKKMEMEKRINHMATHDELTGLPNRISFKQELMNQCDSSRNEHSSLAVMMLDFQGFKYINSALGIQSGNQMVIQMIIRLKAFLGIKNFISRYSEDQFAIIAKDLRNPEDYEAMAQSVASLFTRPFKVDIYEFPVTMNMGISIFSHDIENSKTADDEDSEQISDELIRHANVALLWARKEGKNHYQFYSSDISIQNYKQFELRNDLRKAIEKNQFEVYYQPVVQLETTEILAAEALIRWNHPDWGMVSPQEFIYLAEETGAIVEMGKWMLREICSNSKNWKQKGIPQTKVTINFSSIQFYEKDFVENIKSILDEFQFDPKFLIIELTESLLSKDGDKVMADIQRLQTLGIKVALDDIGTGLSSLAYLNTFNIDVLKMDSAFIRNIMFDKKTAIIARTIVNLARDLEIKLVAVGIENWEQLSFLQEANCHAGQGYLYSRPLPLTEFENILKSGKCDPAFLERTTIDVSEEKRQSLRLDFEPFIEAELTIIKILEKKMNVGNTKILIKNIGPSGLCFISNIKFPIEQEFTLRFTTILFDRKIETHGTPVWIEEIEQGFYQYGVDFTIDQNEREELTETLIEIQAKLTVQ